jgi:DNA repair protein SbcC/Rad50
VSAGGLYAILGDIRDSTGTDSNGAGKSSILEAFEIALFGRRSLAPYLTRGVDDDLLVELEFEHAGTLYRVRRTFSPRGRGRTTLDLERLEVDQWEPLTAESTKETQARLETLIGLSRDTFRHSSYLRQQSRSFADESLEPRERKRLLTEAVLGRDPVWPRLLDRARADKNTANGALLELAGRTRHAQEQAAALPNLVREHGDVVEAETVAADNAADLERAKAELADEYQAAREHAARRTAAEAELKTAEAAHEALTVRSQDALKAAHARVETVAALEQLPAVETVGMLEALAARHTAVIEEHRAATVERERIVQTAREAQQQRDGLLLRATAAKTRADEINVQISHIEDGHLDTCPTCKQALGADARVETVQTLTAQVVAAGDELRRLRLEADAVTIPEVPAELEPPVESQEGLKRTNELLEGARAAVAQRGILEERIRQYDAVIAPSPDELVTAQTLLLERRDAVATVGEPPNTDAIAARGTQVAEELARARASVDQHRQQRARLEERLTVARAAETLITEAAEEQARLQGDVDVAVALERAYSPNGIPALILENSAIPYIETEASRILTLLGCPYTIELRTQADLKSGEGVRETLDVTVIDDRGEPAPFEEGTSGGEKTRIGLALRIALARLLAHRRGAQSRMLALDEPGDLDESGMAALVDVLRDLQDEFALIFLVSHVPGLRDSFDTTLTVEKQDGVSRIVEAGVFESVLA